ncbi:MAG: hypothetical protein V1875_01215 [Candidatus Altiarchaeota archaeon]
MTEAKSQPKPARQDIPPVVSEEEKQKLLQMSEISLWLDGYDDIFSDFDPRSLSERALSDDFLNESKKASREKTSGTIDLKFLIPAAKHDPKTNETVKKRLHEHFRKHHSILLTEVTKLKRQGMIIVACGMGLMMASTYIRTASSDDFLGQFLIVLLEPSGWFITWFGFDQIFYGTNQKKADLEFYAKMSHCEIHFLPY